MPDQDEGTDVAAASVRSSIRFMAQFDVFNGDADGICALHQLRLAAPATTVPHTLVTGVKRDVELLARVGAQPGDSVTVLDISLDTNRTALLGLLQGGVRVEYFDHHFAGDIPRHTRLTAVIDTAPDVCTSLLVDRHLAGRHRAWAIVAAFGDNLAGPATRLAQSIGLDPEETRQLRELGEAINYNAYGETEADLIMAPAMLYRMLEPYADPLDFLANESIPQRLIDGRRQDLTQAMQVQPVLTLGCGTVYLLPDAPWARRVHGAFSNQLASGEATQAHAVLTELTDGGYLVSVRAPQTAPQGADRLCRQFPTGGGRAAAAGINRLPREQFPDFIRAFELTFSAGPA